MKTIEKALLLFFVLVVYTQTSKAQLYGPELIPSGNFGTVASEGKNGDGGVGTNIYPNITGGTTNIPEYFQPVQRAYHNGQLIYININPNVTIGHPLVGKTSYTWGMNEPWTSNTYSFPRTDGSNSNVNIPHAPNNGNYLIATSTKGMYNLPSLNAHAWFEIVDKYEVDPMVPTNYFLVTNADPDASKIFYNERIPVIPGQVYRMSVDLARLNSGNDAPPNIDFIIHGNGSELTTAPIAYETGNLPLNNGEWVNYSFDYIAPCDASDSTYVAFRNKQTNTGGNDVALDNLSMKTIIPLIQAQINACDSVSFVMLNNIISGAFDPAVFNFQWQKKISGVFQDIAGATDIEHPVSEVGTYRIAIFTPATSSCPMYSNEITITLNDLSCLEIAHPRAINDIYELILTSTKDGNILDNDLTSDPANIPHSALSVNGFIIGDAHYPSGSTGIIYGPDGTTQIGVITVQRDGNFTSQFSTSFEGFAPAIKYVITEDGGGRDTATINFIRITSYTYILDASCVSCPVDMLLISPFLDPAHDYTIYKGDSLIQHGVVTGDSLNFNFMEKQSGFIDYTFKINGEKIITVSVLVSPDKATWAPNLILASDIWEQSANWKSDTGNGYPRWCTDVIIPDSAAYYPVLSEFSYNNWCRDITFKNGATIGKVHYLNYRKAFVELEPTREDWTMLSAPLKYMYSADYSADPTWGTNAAVDPKIYMRYFDIKFDADTTVSIPNPDGTKGVSIGNFSVAFRDLKESLPLAKGYVVKVDQGSNDKFNGTFKFPRLNADSTEVLFKYHYRDTGNWVDSTATNVAYWPFRFTDSGQAGRGTEVAPTQEEMYNQYENNEDLRIRGIDNQYRFIYENGSDVVSPFYVTVANAGTTNIVGNPFMSHIDFEKFNNDNLTRIQPYYRIWDGTVFHSYLSGGTKENNAWAGLPPVGTIEQGSRYIKPMQAFFVDLKSGMNQVLFNPDSISVTGDTIPSLIPRSLRSAEEGISDMLRINLKMGNYNNQAIVALLPLASDKYDPSEDVYKLFSYDNSIPEVYTVADKQGIEINAISIEGETKTIPLGIKTTQTGKFEISVDNIDNFGAYSQLLLKDIVYNKVYDLRKTSSAVFDKTESGNIEGRLYLVMSGNNASGIEDNNNDNESSVSVSSENGSVIVSSPLYDIEKLELYDVSGRMQYRKEGVNSLRYSFNPGLESGVFLLKVKTTLEEKSFKIKL